MAEVFFFWGGHLSPELEQRSEKVQVILIESQTKQQLTCLQTLRWGLKSRDEVGVGGGGCMCVCFWKTLRRETERCEARALKSVCKSMPQACSRAKKKKQSRTVEAPHTQMFASQL